MKPISITYFFYPKSQQAFSNLCLVLTLCTINNGQLKTLLHILYSQIHTKILKLLACCNSTTVYSKIPKRQCVYHVSFSSPALDKQNVIQILQRQRRSLKSLCQYMTFFVFKFVKCVVVTDTTGVALLYEPCVLNACKLTIST